MDQGSATTGAVLRLSIVSDDRRLDAGVPAQVPLVEIIPGFARSLGVLDPALAHGGYALHRADGTALDPSRGALAQGVHDGELLTLVRGGLVPSPRVYDDVVEAVIDATSEQHGVWTPKDSARTALFISLTFLALCALLLVSSGGGVLSAVIAGGGAVVLTAAAAVLLRLEQTEAGHALGLAAAFFGGLCGFLAVPGDSLWGWPFAAGGLGMLIVGGINLAIANDKPEIHLVPIALGAAIGIPAALTALFDAPVAPYALMLAITATLANGLPWLVLTSTRIRVISPQSDADIFSDPTPIDGDEVKRRAASGTRALIALRAALGIAALVATPLVAAQGLPGAILCLLAFIGMMFQSRQVHARRGVLVLMIIGALGLAATGLTVALAQPDLRQSLLVVLLAATIVLIGLTLMRPRARLRLARVADTVEVIAMALVLPLGVITAGLL
ncbi:type VII secretion integral membrane protein EccD [Microbacterium sp. 13-71-7]|jgi:type VII secretion integral membrane protein EccD|uniref:type VII secretion integral membrane protein EccD n=1 Tax=Microbacterium sp. 13-71-7 TaxID=1970399 RepID=UPI000BCC8D58|nr:type VII secretion integral membrane protein EccD [Microbacterium sp. 13-71-7]OZB80495.1 MAG: type VII secretion integral membrane protein EccD [Microbacterium sp. 13-71-7]